jgi:hypothetical protein
VRDMGVEGALKTVAQLSPWNPISKLIRQQLAAQ